MRRRKIDSSRSTVIIVSRDCMYFNAISIPKRNDTSTEVNQKLSCTTHPPVVAAHLAWETVSADVINRHSAHVPLGIELRKIRRQVPERSRAPHHLKTRLWCTICSCPIDRRCVRSDNDENQARENKLTTSIGLTMQYYRGNRSVKIPADWSRGMPYASRCALGGPTGSRPALEPCLSFAKCLTDPGLESADAA